MSTLEEKWNNLKGCPGHVEALMLDDLVKEVDALRKEVTAMKEAMKLQSIFNQILEKILKLHIEKEPTYGPMLEDEE